MQSCVHSFFFFARPTDLPSREGGQWETKHFIGMAKTIASLRDILRMRFAAGFWPPRFRNLGRILASEIPRDLSRILAAEI